MRTYHPDAQWFESLGPCASGCGKPATGVLRGHTNERRGNYCASCAETAIKLAHKKGKHVPDYVLDFANQKAKP